MTSRLAALAAATSPRAATTPTRINFFIATPPRSKERVDRVIDGVGLGNVRRL
jgi:hypothetical protein